MALQPRLNRYFLRAIAQGLVLLWAVPGHATPPPTISQSCPGARTVTAGGQIRDLRASIVDAKCHIASGQQDAVDTAQDALGILSHFQDDHSAAEAAGTGDQAQILREKLNQLGRQLTLLKRANPEEAAPTPLGQKMRDLARRYNSPEKRRTHAAEYYADLKSVLALTQGGQSVLSCWNAVGAPLFVGEQIYMTAEGANVPFTAQFNARTAITAEQQRQHDERIRSGQIKLAGGIAPPALMVDIEYPGARNPALTQYKKSMTLNPEGDPIETLHTLAHEMRHGCDAPADLDDGPANAAATERAQLAVMECINQEHKTEAQCKAKPEIVELHRLAGEAKRKKDLDSLLSECNAYTLQVRLFGEIAAQDPRMVCGFYYRSGVFGGKVISSAEYFSTYEHSMAAGNFINQLGAEYAEDGDYSPEGLFEMTAGRISRTAAGVAILKPSVAAFLRTHGCASVATP